MKVMITGGLGFVGTHLSVRVFDMCPSACSGMVLCSWSLLINGLLKYAYSCNANITISHSGLFGSGTSDC